MSATTTFRMGCSGSGDLITADELFEVLIMILPEADVIKSAFMKWMSLPDEMKGAIETRLKHLTSSDSVIPSSLKELNLHKGYSMSRILLRVFREWNHIQDTLGLCSLSNYESCSPGSMKAGAPGIQPGFTALPKRLEMDIAFMMKCLQEVLESVIREQSGVFTRLTANSKGKRDGMGKAVLNVGTKGIGPRLSFSETSMSAGDHKLGINGRLVMADLCNSRVTVPRSANKKLTVSDEEELESSENDNEDDDESETDGDTADEAEDFYPEVGLEEYLRADAAATSVRHSNSDGDTDVEEGLDEDDCLPPEAHTDYIE